MSDTAGLKFVRVEIPFVKQSATNVSLDLHELQQRHSQNKGSYLTDTSAVEATIVKYIPVPANSALAKSTLVVQYNEKLKQEEEQSVLQETQKLQEKNLKSNTEDRDQWLARAMKRNTELLTLFERMRPLSKKDSFSLRVFDKYRVHTRGKKGSIKRKPTLTTTDSFNDFSIGSPPNDESFANTLEKEKQSQGQSNVPRRKLLDFSEFVSTTENRDVLSRETLIQLIHQHLYTKGYTHTIDVLGRETGVKFNKIGVRDPSYLRSLMEIGIPDASRIYNIPSAEYINIEVDTEVQTASIYNHLDAEYAEDSKKKLWEELSSPNEWDNIEADNEGGIRGATLNKLVEKLTDQDQAVPEVLLSKLLERYKVPDIPIDPNINESDWKKMKINIQIRTGNVLQKWIDDFFYLDWNAQMIRMLMIFIDDFLLKHKQTAGIGKTVKRKLNRKLLAVDKDSDAQFSSLPPVPIVPVKIFTQKLSLLDIDPQEIARQLTITEHDIYRKIQPSELLNQAWSKEKLKHRAPNILELTARFNIISNWVAYQIVSPTTLKERKNVFIKIVAISRQLFKLNNFNTLLAFLSGTTNAGVHRLKHTFSEIEKKVMDDYQQMIDSTSSNSSYKSFRNHLLSVSPPCVPFLGIYLTDLTFVEDGNPDFISHKKTNRSLINWTKRKFVYNVIAEVQQYQLKPYNLQSVEQIQSIIKETFDAHKFQSDQQLFAFSLEREPRGAERNQIV